MPAPQPTRSARLTNSAPAPADDIRIPEPAFDFGNFLIVGDRVVLLECPSKPLFKAIGIQSLIDSLNDARRNANPGPARRFAI